MQTKVKARFKRWCKLPPEESQIAVHCIWNKLDLRFCTLQTKQNHTKQTQRKRRQNTVHCRQCVKQTTQIAEKVVEHTMPKKTEVEHRRYAGNEVHTGSRVSNSRWSKNVTDGKSSD